MKKNTEHLDAFAQSDQAENFKIIKKHEAQAGFYSDIDPGVSVRPGYGRENYEALRPNERIPNPVTQQDYRNIMVMCRMAYEKVGVIRSTVDMMSEFGAEGIEIIHPDAGPNKFYQSWSKRVNLKDRAERFLSWFYKSGNTVVRRKFGKVEGSLASPRTNFEPGRIPLEYVFYDPSTVDAIGGDLAGLSSDKIYALRVPIGNLMASSNPKNPLEKEVFDGLPQEIKDAIQGRTSTAGVALIRIPNDKVYICHYKKDDSEIWGKSFIYSILEDVFYNNKLKLAKTSALDGWYNVIRLWKVGDHTQTPRIFPSAQEMARLSSVLQQNTGGGAADILWHSAIDLQEFYPPIEKLQNFEENIDAILLGLGVPKGLVGGEAAGGVTLNYIGLKNLLKRLEAGRRALTHWLEKEVDIIQEAMGFRTRPFIKFSIADLYDEKTYYDILIQLVDRGVLSDETMLDRIKEITPIERKKIKKEIEMRDEEKLYPKASPFFSPESQNQRDHEVKTIKMQGEIEKEKIAIKPKTNSNNVSKNKGVSVKKAGRPSGTRDSTKRVRRPNRPAKASSYLIQANKI